MHRSAYSNRPGSLCGALSRFISLVPSVLHSLLYCYKSIDWLNPEIKCCDREFENYANNCTSSFGFRKYETEKEITMSKITYKCYFEAARFITQ